MHDYVFVHYCTFLDCKDGPQWGKSLAVKNKVMCGGIWTRDMHCPHPLGCPKCDKRFASKQSQRGTHCQMGVFWIKVSLKQLYVLKVLATKDIGSGRFGQEITVITVIRQEMFQYLSRNVSCLIIIITIISMQTFSQ